MKKWFANWNLTRKILLIPLVTILLMWVGLASAATVAIQSSYENRVGRIIEQTVEETSRYVSTELRNVVTLVHYSLLDGQLQAALKSDLNGDIAEYISAEAAIVSTLEQLRIQNDFIESAALTVQGHVFDDGLHQVDYDMNGFLEQARQTQLVYWSDAVVINQSTGRLVIPVVMRAPTGDFSTINEAYILVNLDAQKLFEYIRSLENSLECSLILHSGESVLYDRSGLFGHTSHSTQVIHDTSLEINEWYLCCVMERSTLYASRNAAIQNMLYTSVLVAVVCILFSALVARTIVDPVRRLTEAADRVAEGDYTVQTTVDSADEIGKLGRTFNGMTRQIRQNIQALEEKNVQIAQSEQQKRKAEMQALQAQINPHFLYNTLDSVYWYALSGRQKDIGLIVEKLSDMLRIGLSKGSEYIPVEKELRHVQDYLGIQKTIFSEKFDYTVQIDGDMTGLRVLKILLQPLVENSINHGFANMERGGTISVLAQCNPEGMRLRVADNGCGFELAEKSGGATEYSGFALNNLSERLTAHYGDAASLTIASEPYRETTVEIFIRSDRLKDV